MDISDTLAPKSDQLDNVELADGPRIFTITEVTRNNADQPINVHLAEFPRPWRPGKNMRRVLGYCLTTDSSKWIGRRVELYRDPDVMFGKSKEGGIRIRALSGIDGPKDAPIILTRGKSGTWHVEPLADAAPRPDYATQAGKASTRDELNRIWKTANDAGHLDGPLQQALKDRAAQLASEGGDN